MRAIEQLITDRNASDIARANALIKKILTDGLSSLSASEKTEYMSGLRGKYNYTDLNRVEEAMDYLSTTLKENGYPVSVNIKKDWTVSDTPSMAQMDTYIANINALRAVLPLSTVPTPGTMRWMSLEKANAIEQILQDLNNVVLLVISGYTQCGEMQCGES